MLDEILLERVTLDPEIMVGKPVIRGTRLTVEAILKLLVSGGTFPDVRAEYPGLTDDDIRACILFATKTMETTTFLPLVPAEA